MNITNTLSASLLALLLPLVAACPTSPPNPGPEPTPAPPEPERCDTSDHNALPVQFERIDGLVSAEDFALAPDGSLVSVDESGNFISNPPGGGSPQIVSPGLVEDSAGIAWLPSGQVVVADVSRGALIKVDPTTGGSTTILSGLSYPNGVEVHRDGWVAVAEQDSGQVRRVDPETGAFVVLATGLTNPNGVTFSPDWNTLFVGSFGGGTVHSVPLSADGAAGDPELFASMGASGDDDDAGDLPDWAGDPWYEGCAGQSEGDACTVLEASGTCVERWDMLLCESDEDPFIAACDGLSDGDSCSIDGYDATCQDWGKGILCWQDSWWGGGFGGEGGGIDGIAVDACGYVYVTVYENTGGNILRATERGAEFEVVADLPVGWVPNMEFGNGVDRWDERTLYVNTRDTDSVFGLAIGALGRPRAE